MKISKVFLTFSVLVNFALVSEVFSQVNVEVLEERTGNIDSAVADLVPKIVYPYEITVFDERDKKEYTILIEDPAIVEKRLKSIEQTMPMVYNESVKKYIDFFLIRRPSFTRHMMEEKDAYFPIFERYLEENEMPQELKYLAILESGLNPKAVSRSKAVGLWQFMSFTGKEMGLIINDYIDERMHIEKSTDAACKYLEILYNRFQDWDLALASYNTGPGRISRTIKSTGKTNYWDLHPHIHPDTRAYVPQFIALAYLMNFGQNHGIKPRNKKDFTPTEKVNVNSFVDFNILAGLSGIELSEIKRLNPQFKKDFLPEMPSGYEIALPADKMVAFNSNRDFILDSASRSPLKNLLNPVAAPVSGSGEAMLASSGTSSGSSSDFTTLNDGTIIIGRKSALVPELVINNSDEPVKYKNITRQVKKTHRVKRGEFMNRIADKYDVTVSEIKRWNNKKSSKVLVGERLTIYVNQKERVKANSLAAKSSSENIKKPKSYHTVKRGDTLWNISQRYDGVSIDDIKRWNNIKGNTVKVGQRIKIKS
ncbi:MAG: transglycosylase SLT domain-containing protein [Bacteroidetes bacterium]|nr:transglycosylase SLT domain-containing protein [Bacteroidota bacterium]